MKKRTKPQDELVTKEYLDHTLRYRFGRFHSKMKQEIQEESHSLEFRMNQRFEAIEKKIDAQTNYVQKAVDKVMTLADIVIREHKEFEEESASIKYNYEVLENRLKKVEEVVFPNQ